MTWFVLQAIFLVKLAKIYFLSVLRLCWRGGRVVEGARLESVYTVTPYRGFESLSLRQSLKLGATHGMGNLFVGGNSHRLAPRNN